MMVKRTIITDARSGHSEMRAARKLTWFLRGPSGLRLDPWGGPPWWCSAPPWSAWGLLWDGQPWCCGGGGVATPKKQCRALVCLRFAALASGALCAESPEQFSVRGQQSSLGKSKRGASKLSHFMSSLEVAKHAVTGVRLPASHSLECLFRLPALTTTT
jgi:hypothetical protein